MGGQNGLGRFTHTVLWKKGDSVDPWESTRISMWWLQTCGTVTTGFCISLYWKGLISCHCRRGTRLSLFLCSEGLAGGETEELNVMSTLDL